MTIAASRTRSARARSAPPIGTPCCKRRATMVEVLPLDRAGHGLDAPMRRATHRRRRLQLMVGRVVDPADGDGVDRHLARCHRQRRQWLRSTASSASTTCSIVSKRCPCSGVFSVCPMPDSTLPFRSGSPTRHGQADHPVVREHVAIERIEGRLVDVGREHALFEIIEVLCPASICARARRNAVAAGTDGVRLGT